MNQMTEETHRTTQARLKRSHKVVKLAARIVRRLGLHVSVQPLKIAPTYQQRRKFSDHGDMYVTYPNGAIRRLEIKQMVTTEWESPEVFPYPDRFFLMGSKKYDEAIADGLPIRYILVFNHAMTWFAVYDPVKQGHPDPRAKAPFIDPGTRLPDKVYTAPVSKLKFVKVPPELLFSWQELLAQGPHVPSKLDEL